MASSPIERSTTPLVEAQLELLYSGRLADATVRCKGVEWRVHRSILCPRSAFFEACLNGNFREAFSSVVDFQEDEPYAVEGLLIFLYTLEYPNRSSSCFSQSKPEPNPNFRLEATMDRSNQATISNTSTDPCASKIQLRSQPTKHGWQESMALCRIGDKFGVNRLRDEATAEILVAAKTALKSSSAMQFFWEFFQMSQEGVQRMRPSIIALAAEDVSKLTVSPRFHEFVANNPAATCLLVEALGKNIPKGMGNVEGQSSPSLTGRGAFRGRGRRGSRGYC